MRRTRAALGAVGCERDGGDGTWVGAPCAWRGGGSLSRFVRFRSGLRAMWARPIVPGGISADVGARPASHATEE
ncbi:hypothetical protein E2562_009444 [Oryza meyeriana var. granulata]|uniref:Uncharacterized protein n=1 Tax=Oryza meyeriana var. granulata TaxID=110450 RepID=A0A6G1BU43_9ORYZ|nr:hypothetical protein E2562_009444 [Oryza meyeriana var. granulata]